MGSLRHVVHHTSPTGLPLCGVASPLPQSEEPPMPYKFSNEVSETDAEPRGIFWTLDEEAKEDNPGRVEGSYTVWLPDGRLMKVSYYVDGDSGFVPSIEYIDDYSPSF